MRRPKDADQPPRRRREHARDAALDVNVVKAALRALVTTTPGQWRLAGLLLVAATIAFGVVAATAAMARDRAADSVAGESGPLVVEAARLYASLADADATAAGTFLTGSLETQGDRRRYLLDLEAASERVVSLASRVRASSEARAAAARIAGQVPLYSGLLETARVNNRQGLPVGAAYLRQANDIMRDRILLAARQLFVAEARQLDRDYRAASGTGALVAVAVAGIALLLVLVAVQVHLARRTRRVFNIPMMAATLVHVSLVAWLLVAFGIGQQSLEAAQRDGTDPVQVLSATRFLALRAHTDERLALAARGGGERYERDYEAAMSVLTDNGGLLDEAARLADRTGTRQAVESLKGMLAVYQATHERVIESQSDGQFEEAVQLAVGPSASAALSFERFNAALGEEIAAAERRFRASVDDATSASEDLVLAIPLTLAVCAMFFLLGLRQRIVEYA